MKNIFNFTIAMGDNNIKIKLDFADDADVKLDNMSLTALESFLKVTNALKNIVSTVSENITFSIEKGSAAAVAYGTTAEIKSIYDKIDEAIEGESEDEIITKNLRDIQSEIQNEIMRYQFFYSDLKLEDKIKSASRIQKKKVYKNYRNEIRIITGKFDEVGGSKINYHLEQGSGNRFTVVCSEFEALDLKDYLFKNISCLVTKKTDEDDLVKPVYTHCAFLHSQQISKFRSFFNSYQELQDIIRRLDLIYDFFDASDDVVKDMSTMLQASTKVFHDVNELKTLLILSNGMKENPMISKYREILNENFKSQMSKY